MGCCLMQASQQERTAELAVTSVDPVLLFTLRLPVSLGCPPPSGKMTVSCKTTCHLVVFAWVKGEHLHWRKLECSVAVM